MPIDYEHELSNGWNKWQNLVLQGMQRLDEQGRDHSEKLEQIVVDIAVVKNDLGRVQIVALDQEGRMRHVEGEQLIARGIRTKAKTTFDRFGVVAALAISAIVGLSSLLNSWLPPHHRHTP